jgi:hypothetical protein
MRDLLPVVTWWCSLMRRDGAVAPGTILVCIFTETETEEHALQIDNLVTLGREGMDSLQGDFYG